MRPPAGRALATCAALSLALFPQSAHADVPPIKRVATGGELLCPAGLDGTIGSVYIADPCANKILAVTNGAAVVLRGTGGTSTDGQHPDDIPHPSSLQVNGLGVIKFTDNPPSSMILVSGRVRQFALTDPNKTITDSGIQTGVDLVGLSYDAFGVTGDGYFGASYSAVIRNLSGTVVAGNGSKTGSLPTSSNPTGGSIGAPLDTAIDPAATTNVFFSTHLSSGPDRVFKLTNAGNSTTDSLTTVAGGAAGPSLGDGGSPTAAWLSNPTSIVALDDGGLLIYDAGHSRIRRVGGGTITTIAGNGTAGLAADGTPAATAPLEAAGDMTLTGGGLNFSQPSGHAIQQIPALAIASAPAPYTSARSASFSFSSWDSAAHFKCGLNGAAMSDPCGPFNNLTDGQYSVQIQAKTNNQTLSSIPTSYSWTVDGTAPSAPELIGPDDGAGRLHTLTPFSWKPASDVTSGIDHYDLLVDDTLAGTLAAADCADTCTLTPAALPEAAHTWQVLAVDKAGNSTPSATRSMTIAVPPVAALVLAPARSITGRSVTLDASASSDEGAGIAKYEFDTNGDGTFETDNGSTATVTKTYTTPATLTLRARVTDGAGLTSVATAVLTVTSTPPAGKQLGVSVNDGAQYTNDPNVTIFAVWPSFASDMLVSNDGGFKNPSPFAVKEQIPWKLDSSGPERLPKTVYVRFIGGIQTSETYTDDIILDETPPKVLAADLAAPAPAGAPASAAKAALATLKVRAKDNVSGVGKMQVTRNKKKPGRLIKYKKSVKVVAAAKLYVRVRDKAGNLSRWRTVKRG